MRYDLRSIFGACRGVLSPALICLLSAWLLPVAAVARKPDTVRKAPAAEGKKSAKPAPLKLPAAAMAQPKGKVMRVVPVDRATRPQVAAAATRIDELLAKHWQQHGVAPSDLLNDAQFARRIYLDLGGRIPSYDEAVRFLDGQAESRRADLIDRLLESPDYVSHTYNVWADILRLCERPQKDLYFEPYLDWVKRSIAANTPYDTWVHDMLTADGKVWENPAAGFQLRDKGMPLPYVDNTVRVFLGTQIGCAQCHDHPFDTWTQHQFYELAAFTSGTQMRQAGSRGKDEGASQQGAQATKKANAEAQRRVKEIVAAVREKVRERKFPGDFNQFVAANLTSVHYRPAKLLLPHDYQYDDDEPLAAVAPKVLWGEAPTATGDGRRQFAGWVTSRDNRQFARTIANRMWRRAMGVGLVEPVDDFKEDNPASYPELLEHLTDEMLRLDFDLREFLRLLVSTAAYQRRAVLHDPTSAAPFRFTGPVLRRMTAEQLWDSILTLVARNEWAFQRPESAAFAKLVDVDLAATDTTYADVERTYRKFADTYGISAYRKRMQTDYGYKGQVLVRASELPAPLPLGHFLRQFGQSDREVIEGGRTVATVPQILAMFNGPITHSMLERGSVIYDEVLSHPAQDAVDVVFMSLLTRRPSAEDRALASEEVRAADTPAAGCGNLIWALLNTREFIFIQ